MASQMTTQMATRIDPRARECRTDGRTDGRTDTPNRSQDTSNLSQRHVQDDSLRTLLTELVETIKRGEPVSATRRDVSQGQIYIFRVQPAGALSPDERFRICLDWMRRNQITNRKAFFAGCPEAAKNCQMHNRCIRALVRAGEIERAGREYIFVEDK